MNISKKTCWLSLCLYYPNLYMHAPLEKKKIVPSSGIRVAPSVEVEKQVKATNEAKKILMNISSQPK